MVSMLQAWNKSEILLGQSMASVETLLTDPIVHGAHAQLTRFE